MARACWLAALLLSACAPTSDESPDLRIVGGVASGVDGPVVVSLNDVESLTLTADGPFAFATPLAEGATFWISVVSRPADVSCERIDAVGTVGGSDVTIGLSCAPAPVYTVGGALTGATGPLDLDVDGTIMSLASNGPFTLPGRFHDGDAYDVAIAAAPSTQTCSIANGTGHVPDAHVADVAVTCVTDTWKVGGTLSGATGAVVLRNQGEDLTVPDDGEFTFVVEHVQGAPFGVTVVSEPAGQDCEVTGGEGFVGAADVSDVAVACETLPTHAITGPNGGERWIAGDTVAVTWTPLTQAATVDVDLIVDGTVAETIAQDTADDGSFDYTIPLALDPGEYSVRVTPSAGTPDASDATFVIASLVTYVWNGTTEDIVRVDPFTGATLVIGQVGDLLYWSGNTAVDHEAGVLYVEASSPKKLHEIDLATGDYLGSTVPTDGLMGLVVAPDGALLYGKWDGANSEEELWRIDPDTGAAAQFGTIGTLKSWHGQMVVHDGALYAAGYNGATKHVWKLDPLTGALLDTFDLPDGVQGFQVRGDGAFLYCKWNGSAEELRVYDPVAEADTLVGLVGDLGSWSGGTAIDAVNGRIFVFGNGGGARKVYVLDAYDGTLLASPALPFSGSPNAVDLAY